MQDYCIYKSSKPDKFMKANLYAVDFNIILNVFPFARLLL
jgi:hypothetical protein